MRKKTKDEFCHCCGTQFPCYDGCISFKEYFDIPLNDDQKKYKIAIEQVEIMIDSNPELIKKLVRKIDGV